MSDPMKVFISPYAVVKNESGMDVAELRAYRILFQYDPDEDDTSRATLTIEEADELIIALRTLVQIAKRGQGAVEEAK